jgi:hypothetical protein
MRTYHQPSGLTTGLDFLIDSDWTPEQALAVVELLDDLKDRILLHYQLPIILKTAVDHIPANKNQHKLDKENCVM